jgi:hypothetical protein
MQSELHHETSTNPLLENVRTLNLPLVNTRSHNNISLRQMSKKTQMIERQMLKIDSLRGAITKNNQVMIQNNLGIELTERANSSLAEDTTSTQQATSPDAEETESPTELRSRQLTPVQRLNIAKAEWSKLFHSNPSQHNPCIDHYF